MRAATVLALALAGVYALAISWLAVAQHATFHTRARDMGIYAQVLWNTGHGRPFASTLLADNSLHLAEHVAPVLALLAPLYAMAPDPRLLLVLQQVCLAGAGLPLFFWTRQRVGDPIALVLLAGFYAMPALSRVALSEFHPIVVAALPISLGVKAVLDGRVRASVCWLVLALLIEEETAPIVGAAGAYLLLIRRRPFGLALGGLATVWLLAVVLLLMPAFHDRETLARADGTRTVAHFDLLRQDPSVALDWLAGERGAEAAVWLLGPAAGLPLLAPAVLALGVPSFAVLFLQDREGTFAGHWSAAMLPVVWFAAGAGLVRLAGWAGPHRQVALGLAVTALMLAGGLSYARFSLFPGGRGFDGEHFARTEHEDDLARAAALVQPNVRLDATRRVVPHLAHRAEVYQFPSTFYSAPMRPDLGRIDVFLLDLTDSPTRRALDASEQDTVVSKRPRLHARLFGDDVLLLTRERPTPGQPADAVFGEALRLTGYDLERRPSGLRLSPAWETIGRPGAWTRVAELVGADGQSIARAEAAPLDPYLPPARWDRGQIVVDSIDLHLPPALPPGPYRVTLAWLDAAGRPIRLRDAAELVEIGPVDLGWGAP
ncbi:MAG: DUF2079 domain-containing protein [Chloroflexi bacterium]|nr:DUF2079 domain-containing protein [Chloroflexota bacterium]